MTNLEALKGKVAGYPLKDEAYLSVLIDRKLGSQDEYEGKSKAFDLAMADLYITLITGVNISEGGYQISIAERNNFIKVANGLYIRHGEKPFLEDPQPIVTGASPW